MEVPQDAGYALPQDEALARTLSALAHPRRLALLRQLREPRVLREIEIKFEAAGDAESGRNISRQAVREHLNRLLEIGAVEMREAKREYGLTVEYSLNHQTLFAVAEEFRGLTRLRPAAEPRSTTVHRPDAPHPFSISGPCLVLVKGLEEGRTFRLDPPRGARRASWIVGRSRGVPIALDFDPYVSAENTEIAWDGAAYRVRDLAGSLNGTLLNFHALPEGASHPIATGDLLGVGRSLLMFRE